MTVKDMKTMTSFLLGILLLLFGAGPALAGSVCDRTGNPGVCKTEHKKGQSRHQIDKTQKRSLRRQHTREAYDWHDMTRPHGIDGDASHFHKSKKMTPDERNRLRQQIDEAGQAIYHQ